MTAEIGRTEFKAEEWWNGHAHLARVIGSMALNHRDLGQTYPAFLTVAEWHRILTGIGEPLMAYANGIDDLEGYEERRRAAQEALELFAQWFDQFTD